VHHNSRGQVGDMAGATINLPASVLRSTAIELMGQGPATLPPEHNARAQQQIPALFTMAAEGKLSLTVERHPLRTRMTVQRLSVCRRVLRMPFCVPVGVL
jgi:hypothetical protein